MNVFVNVARDPTAATQVRGVSRGQYRGRELPALHCNNLNPNPQPSRRRYCSATIAWWCSTTSSQKPSTIFWCWRETPRYWT